MPDLAERLDALFAASTDPRTGRSYSNRYVATALAQNWDVSVSHTYLSQLRLGQTQDPAASILGALAQFFDVPIDYFFTSTVRFEPEELRRRLEFALGLGPAADIDALVERVQADVSNFDRAAWEKLLHGERPVYVRTSVLEAIADFLNVKPEYLTTPDLDDELKTYEAQLDLAAAVAQADGKGSAMRAVGAPSPESLRAIAASIRATFAEDNDSED